MEDKSVTVGGGDRERSQYCQSLHTTETGLLSELLAYLVYGVLKSFLLRVGFGQRVSMMLCELHSPIPLPLESRFKDEHNNCSKYGEHSNCHHNRYYIRTFSGGPCIKIM